MVLVKLDDCMSKNPNRFILIAQHKTLLQMDHTLQNKTRYNEPETEKKMGNSLYSLTKGLLKSTPLTLALRSTIYGPS